MEAPERRAARFISTGWGLMRYAIGPGVDPLSAEDYIETRLGITMRDHRLIVVKATFSRLNQALQIREFADATYEIPKPGQPVTATRDQRARVGTAVAQRRELVATGFSRLFAEHLRALESRDLHGMADLADRLSRTEEVAPAPAAKQDEIRADQTDLASPATTESTNGKVEHIDLGSGPEPAPLTGSELEQAHESEDQAVSGDADQDDADTTAGPDRRVPGDAERSPSRARADGTSPTRRQRRKDDHRRHGRKPKPR
jgi:hypothetical protein